MEGTNPEKQENYTETVDHLDDMYLTKIAGDESGPVDAGNVYEEIDGSYLLPNTIPQNVEECENIFPGEGVYQNIPTSTERNLYANSDVTVYRPQ